MIHTFTFLDNYLALDVHSGALHLLDKPAYAVARALEQAEDPYALPYPREETAAILGELDALRAEGSFDSAEQTPPAVQGEPVIKAMCLHIAHDCNLRCRYCFAGTGEYNGGRMLMDEHTACAALEFLMKNSGDRHNLEVDLFGGEPLINFPVVKATVEYGRKLEKQYSKHINFTCTTNAVNLTDEITDFLNAEMHNIVISIDGRKSVHDAMRPTVNGKGSYDIILKNAKKLVARRGEGEYYIRGTFTHANLDFTRDVEALCDEGFTQISVEPVVLGADSPYAITEEDVKTVLAEYDTLAEFLLKRRAEGRWFNFFHFMVDMQDGPCLRKRIAGCGAGGEYVAVTPDGGIYPCHQFAGEKDFLMGSVLNGEFNRAMQQRFLACNILTKPVCRECWAKYFCAGGCAANAWKYNGDIARPHEVTCALERKRTECAMAIYAVETQSEED